MKKKELINYAETIGVSKDRIGVRNTASDYISAILDHIEDDKRSNRLESSNVGLELTMNEGANGLAVDYSGSVTNKVPDEQSTHDKSGDVLTNQKIAKPKIMKNYSGSVINEVPDDQSAHGKSEDVLTKESGSNEGCELTMKEGAKGQARDYSGSATKKVHNEQSTHGKSKDVLTKESGSNEGCELTMKEGAKGQSRDYSGNVTNKVPDDQSAHVKSEDVLTNKKIAKPKITENYSGSVTNMVPDDQSAHGKSEDVLTKESGSNEGLELTMNEGAKGLARDYSGSATEQSTDDMSEDILTNDATEQSTDDMSEDILTNEKIAAEICSDVD